MNSAQTYGDINPAIGDMLRSARDFLTHEHSLFRTLDLKPILIGKGKATFSMSLPKEFAAADGSIHGGLYTIILDSIFGLAVFTALEQITPIATINLRTDYIAAIKPGARAVCEAECEAVEGEVAHVSGRLLNEGTRALLAKASGAFIVGAKGPPAGMML
ncbi:MAG: PaaI family thioesterase [Parvularculaceae bacterium]|nr:PaaI family thioesterase [Parvularculaceae bacterium]